MGSRRQGIQRVEFVSTESCSPYNKPRLFHRVVHPEPHSLYLACTMYTASQKGLYNDGSFNSLAYTMEKHATMPSPLCGGIRSGGAGGGGMMPSSMLIECARVRR